MLKNYKWFYIIEFLLSMGKSGKKKKLMHSLGPKPGKHKTAQLFLRPKRFFSFSQESGNRQSTGIKIHGLHAVDPR